MQMRGEVQISLAFRFGVRLQTKEDEAWWEDFMDRLMDYGYVKRDSPDKQGHDRYKITKQGFDFAKTLPVFDMNSTPINSDSNTKQ